MAVLFGSVVRPERHTVGSVQVCTVADVPRAVMRHIEEAIPDGRSLLCLGVGGENELYYLAYLEDYPVMSPGMRQVIPASFFGDLFGGARRACFLNFVWSAAHHTMIANGNGRLSSDQRLQGMMKDISRCLFDPHGFVRGTHGTSHETHTLLLVGPDKCRTLFAWRTDMEGRQSVITPPFEQSDEGPTTRYAPVGAKALLAACGNEIKVVGTHAIADAVIGRPFAWQKPISLDGYDICDVALHLAQSDFIFDTVATCRNAGGRYGYRMLRVLASDDGFTSVASYGVFHAIEGFEASRGGLVRAELDGATFIARDAMDCYTRLPLAALPGSVREFLRAA